MTDLHLTLGRTRAGAPVIWSGADNPTLRFPGGAAAANPTF